MVRVTVASAEVPAEFVATSVNWVAGKDGGQRQHPVPHADRHPALRSCRQSTRPTVTNSTSTRGTWGQTHPARDHDNSDRVSAQANQTGWSGTPSQFHAAPPHARAR